MATTSKVIGHIASLPSSLADRDADKYLGI